MPSSRPVSPSALALFASVAVFVVGVDLAQAECISQSVGATTVHNCDGKISTSHTVGSTTVYNIDGKIAVSQSVGGTTVPQLRRQARYVTDRRKDHDSQHRWQVRGVADDWRRHRPHRAPLRRALEAPGRRAPEPGVHRRIPPRSRDRHPRDRGEHPLGRLRQHRREARTNRLPCAGSASTCWGRRMRPSRS